MTRPKRGGKKNTKQKKGKDDLSAHGNETDHPAQENETDHLSATSQECQPLPPDVLYFKNTEFTKTCKIQSKCYVSNTVATIKTLKHELKWFENHPQFCHIFHMPDEPYLKLLGVWMLLLRTIPLVEGEDTSWFAVNGVPIRYSIREHALISGLNCSGYPDKYEELGSYEFVDRHFVSHKAITMKSVEEKLLSMRACGDRLRMVVLYFLGTVIRGRGREHVAGCLANCPRMCKWWFQSNSMKGYPLEDLYNALGKTKVIKSVLAPTIDEETLMAGIMEDEPDYENEDGPSNLWSSWLTVKEKPIWWKDLYELDVAARKFPTKKDKRKVNEEASSSNASLEDV
ncbi:uncharacterized protein At3g43530-like [Brassica napus]|uniref:uncharacterized protein At3g43530-like n=1 Tax=Brassica napus TaxID=3708 RepID=UPI00207936FC|nr:uncharacterized protein At3g43530-like [Brassica napus]